MYMDVCGSMDIYIVMKCFERNEIPKCNGFYFLFYFNDSTLRMVINWLLECTRNVEQTVFYFFYF